MAVHRPVRSETEFQSDGAFRRDGRRAPIRASLATEDLRVSRSLVADIFRDAHARCKRERPEGSPSRCGASRLRPIRVDGHSWRRSASESIKELVSRYGNARSTPLIPGDSRALRRSGVSHRATPLLTASSPSAAFPPLKVLSLSLSISIFRFSFYLSFAVTSLRSIGTNESPSGTVAFFFLLLFRHGGPSVSRDATCISASQAGPLPLCFSLLLNVNNVIHIYIYMQKKGKKHR